ncbi:MAG: SagB/ThcOx family dehydrogenase [Anaerolineales bacterium]
MKIGDRFQEQTKYVRGELSGGGLDWANKPETYKAYPDAPKIPLDSPRTKGGTSLWRALKERHSVRSFSDEPLSKMELSRLVWAAQGISHESGGVAFRTAPSAGGLYPIETYVVLKRVEDIEAGVYHYAVAEHALEQLQTGDFSLQTARAALDQRMAYEANVVFVWTSVFERSKWKYKQRAYRYIYLDAGHIAQNVALAAVALGLGSCQIGALYDEEANELLGIEDERESVIYMTAVGREH